MHTFHERGLNSNSSADIPAYQNDRPSRVLDFDLVYFGPRATQQLIEKVFYAVVARHAGGVRVDAGNLAEMRQLLYPVVVTSGGVTDVLADAGRNCDEDGIQGQASRFHLIHTRFDTLFP